MTRAPTNRRIVAARGGFARRSSDRARRVRSGCRSSTATRTRPWPCASIARPSSSPRRGERSSTGTASRSRSASRTTTVYREPAAGRPAARPDARGGQGARPRARADVYRALDRSLARVRLRRPQGRPARRRRSSRSSASPGSASTPRSCATYPQGPVAAQVLGYAGLDNKGLEGLERSLDKVLAGRPGSQTIVKDPFGRALDVVSTRPETPGRNVRLTLDHQIQANAEAVLKETVRRYGARAASAIVMDPAHRRRPRDGDRARASTRTASPRRAPIAGAIAPSPTPTSRDRPSSSSPSPPRLQEGIVSPRTSFLLPPTIQVADRVIHESHPRGTERMTVRQIVERSSNIGTITIAQRLGEGRLANWIERFGFGKTTGIDFPGESPGFALPLDEWSGSTIGTVPIGHGIAVTPIQMAQGVRRDRERRRPRPPAPRRAHRREGGRERGGAGDRLATGVSSRCSPCFGASSSRERAPRRRSRATRSPARRAPPRRSTPNGRYSHSRYVASFVGLVPATKPRLVIMVMVDEPQRVDLRRRRSPLPRSSRSRASTCSISRFRRTRPAKPGDEASLQR